MRHIEGTAPGGGGIDLYWQGWLPDGELKAVVLLAHGLAEHGGRYAHVGSAFSERGYGLFAIDHRGHGKSPGKRTLIDSMDTAAADLHSFAGRVAEKHPGVPVFLYGHSMGGAIALTYALKHQAELAGLILSAPAVVVENVSPVTVAVGRLLARVAPGAGILQLDGSAVSRDAAVVARYDSDPLNYRGKVAARTAAEILAVAQTAPARLPELTLPVLTFQGTADRLVSPRAAVLVHEKAGSADKTLKRYEGGYHEMHNEPEQAQVLGDILDWMDARAGATAQARAEETSTSAMP
jgi:alpha-beta hydrolase superfamily lysophospholipase